MLVTDLPIARSTTSCPQEVTHGKIIFTSKFHHLKRGKNKKHFFLEKRRRNKSCENANRDRINWLRLLGLDERGDADAGNSCSGRQPKLPLGRRQRNETGRKRRVGRRCPFAEWNQRLLDFSRETFCAF
jgi:hypothetical protein